MTVKILVVISGGCFFVFGVGSGVVGMGVADHVDFGVGVGFVVADH